ncbi:hypothetical protein BOX37_14280 [Nocardia mangyaensis]|uniref:Uncharacterized protein n=2 Tax=Nocardia mangyaensis TaxID=2213200 RepID=A0A1J0VSK1_9NOCA|nr:hypothetical protein BOX37_14280 [Nocardia mangyaensis]
MMASSIPAQQFGSTPEYGDAESLTAIVMHDSDLVGRLQDMGLRRLCVSAVGLSPQAQRRLEAIAEALQSAE